MKRTLSLLAVLTLALPASAQTPPHHPVRNAPAQVHTAPTAPAPTAPMPPTPAQAAPTQTAPAPIHPAQTAPIQRPATPPTQSPQPTQTPPTNPPQPGICCCRVWSHGWQYSWRPNGDCTTQNGSCVTPDHC